MKVSVIVITYNQEKYIEQTIRSIANQKTNFDFEIIVGDDCSTDKTYTILQELMSEFTNMRVLRHEKNLGIVRNFMSVYNEAIGSCVSSTGGDDYWIDEFKLQNAVDFMDANREYSLFFTGYKMFTENENKFEDVLLDEDQDISFDSLCKKNPICATTTMYRKELIPYLEESFSTVPVEDWVLWVMYAQKGKVRYSNTITSVYRVHNQSAYSSIDYVKRLLWRFDARVFIWKEFGDESPKDFFDVEKRWFKTFFCSKSQTKSSKLIFLKKIKKLGFKGNTRLIKTLLLFDNRIGRSLLWRLMNYGYETI